MNESLRRALLQAGLNEVDIAARLQVDPKTVRRWLDGRLPYPRYRWALAGILGMDETQLWPQLRVGASLPAEVRAIYPHLGAVPGEVWQRLFGSAQREIDLLTGNDDSVLGDPDLVSLLAERGEQGVAVRICLVCPNARGLAEAHDAAAALSTARAEAEALAAALGRGGAVEIRVRNAVRYATVYRADDELLVSQCAHGIPDAGAPVLRLQADKNTPLVMAYLAGFERIWENFPAHSAP